MIPSDERTNANETRSVAIAQCEGNLYQYVRQQQEDTVRRTPASNAAENGTDYIHKGGKYEEMTKNAHGNDKHQEEMKSIKARHATAQIIFVSIMLWAVHDTQTHGAHILIDVCGRRHETMLGLCFHF